MSITRIVTRNQVARAPALQLRCRTLQWRPPWRHGVAAGEGDATMLKAVLWDNDGVLVDTEHLFFEANVVLFRSHGIELTQRQFFDWYLADNCGAWHLLDGRGVSAAQMDAERAERNRTYALRLAQEDIPAVSGIEQVLAALAPRLRMAVVTSSTGQHFDIIHARLPLRPYFEFVLTAESYVNSKPRRSRICWPCGAWACRPPTASPWKTRRAACRRRWRPVCVALRCATR